ncbi:MAG: dihydrolipoyl dehydrogenase family protein [Fusobacteriaceae bacterium]
MKKYDVIVLGGGAGGLTVSIGLAKAGKKVLLIEKRKIGGECTWSGCIPSKAFIKRSEHGADSSQIFHQVREVIQKIYSHETPEVLQDLGIDVILGEGKFAEKNIIEIDGKHRYWGKNIVISTGSSPGIPEIEGLEKIDYLTNENFFLQEKAPSSIIFIGGGVISLEMAFPLKRLGTSVTILEKNPSFLAFEEPEVRERILESLKKNGIELILGVDLKKFQKSENGNEVILGDGRIFEGEKVFISAGRIPNIFNLNLEKVGISFDRNGIHVDDFMVAAPGIFAVGDSVGPYRFSHIAGYHGEIVLQNILLPFFKKKMKYNSVPWTTFTSPEYSRTGMTEEAALKKYGDALKIYTLNSENDRSVAVGENYFILKVICLKGKILGATCIGDRAGEILGIIQTLMNFNIPFYKYSKTIQSYPTYCDMIRKIAKTAYIDYLRETFPYKLFF